MINKSTSMMFLSAFVIFPAAAEVIKCQLPSGKTVYQTTPCPSASVSQKIVEIKKQDPRQIEEAQTKLKAWQAQQAAEEAERTKAAKEQQMELDRQQTIDALNRNAIAQQQQAIAAQRQAEALERRNSGYLYNGYYPYFFYTPQFYGSQSYGPGNGPYDSGHHEHHWEQTPNSPQNNPAANRPVYPQGLSPSFGRGRQ